MADIAMVGTAPYFYRVLITDALLTAVETASFPNKETVVFRFIPPVPDMDSYVSDGMRPLENRRIVFQCFEALKAILVCLHFSRSCCILIFVNAAVVPYSFIQSLACQMNSVAFSKFGM